MFFKKQHKSKEFFVYRTAAKNRTLSRSSLTRAERLGQGKYNGVVLQFPKASAEHAELRAVWIAGDYQWPRNHNFIHKASRIALGALNKKKKIITRERKKNL